MEIFISFSGGLSRKIATKMKKWLQNIFSTKINSFLSEDIPKGSNWTQALSEKLEKCNYAISILTADNVNNPWINFEAGAICKSNKDNRVCTILFDMDEVVHASPLGVFQYSKFNEKDLLTLLIEINNALESDRLEESSLTVKFKDTWPSFQKNILSLINSYKNQMGGGVKEDGYLDLSPSTVFCGKVTHQSDIPSLTWNIFPNKKIEIKKIPSQLKIFLNDHVSPHYKKTFLIEGLEKTTVLINKTRVSTFFSFTDGHRILLYDRVQGKDKTTIENQRRDVFGSVDFENYSIFDKINNKEFFDCITENIELIPGFVFEDNTTSSASDRETVIMFGYHVYLKPSDLEKGKIGCPAVDLFNIPNRLRGSLQLTAKARHSIESLIDLKKTLNP